MTQEQREEYVPGRRIVKEERQEINEEMQIPIESRTHNYSRYEYRTQERVIAPRRVEPNRTTNYNLGRDLNRQAAVNTAVKNQIQAQAPQRRYAYDSNIVQSQDRSSREGRVYHYEPTIRKEFPGRTVAKKEQRRIVSSVETSQKGKAHYKQIGNDKYQNKVYVSGSGSPGYRRTSNYMEDENNYHSYTRGGVVKFRRWKYIFFNTNRCSNKLW